ncbi:hypothetical protein ACFWB3_29310, partial [[Kitasatospora] papulosa]
MSRASTRSASATTDGSHGRQAERGAPPGDVVILRHPFQQDLLVVKRAVERREGGWWVLGDNAFAGGDSTVYGVVPPAMVLA